MSIGNYITKDKVYPTSSAAVGVYDAREQARHKRESQWPSYNTVATYQASDFNNSTLTTYDFSSTSFGTVSATNYIVVIACATGTSGTRYPTSMSCGGVSMTEIVSDQDGSSGVGVWVGKHTATSGTLSVTYSGSVTNTCGIGVYNISNTDGTPLSATISNYVSSLAMASSVGGCIVAGYYQQNDVERSFVGYTTDYSVDIRSGEWMGGANSNNLSGVSETINIDGSARFLIGVTF
jgi:hypothetical protein